MLYKPTNRYKRIERLIEDIAAIVIIYFFILFIFTYIEFTYYVLAY